ncbi:MAG TPA: tetratricopeptide repeat protein [Burkholderiaceae bacterium]|nr:tetratricopeptide repeat protein [Burkholderiaceae bacterium]
MKQARTQILKCMRMVAVAACLATTYAHADDYGDVAQLVRAGKLPEAMAKADLYLASKPRDPQMRFLKGVIQRDSGKPADAIATFTKLTEDYPELPEPYNNLAVLYAGQSQFDKARTALEMAIRTNPSYATAHENLGDVYARLASQAYNKALQLDNSNTAVPPKLALIRELFTPNVKGQPRPAAAITPSTPAVTPAAPVAAATPPAPAAAVVAQAAKPAAAVSPASPAPVVAAPVAPPAPAAAPASGESSKEAEAAVRAWAAAWARKDMNAYLGAYGKAFDPPGNQSRAAWEEERRSRIVGKSTISVSLENLVISVNGDKAVARFRQSYKADALAVSSRKTLDLVKVGDRWVIVRETAGA